MQMVAWIPMARNLLLSSRPSSPDHVVNDEGLAAPQGGRRRFAEAVEAVAADDALRALGGPVAADGEASWSTSMSA
jgi:predicted NAD/FAD-binding protein